MSLDNLATEYRAELPTAEEFERLFRSSGWTEALDVAADRLAATLPAARSTPQTKSGVTNLCRARKAVLLECLQQNWGATSESQVA
jgi:hypothetical protein